MHQAGRGACQPASRPLGSAGLTAAFYRRGSRASTHRVTLPAMTERITARRFHEAAGVEDWRVLGEGACTYFRTGSFAAGVALAEAISRLAGLGDHHPDVDLRHGGVTVRLITIADDYYGLSERDLELARQISAAARELGVPADPTAVQLVNVTIDALVGPGRAAVLAGAARLPPDRATPDYLFDPRGRGPGFGFQQMDAPRPQRNRVHLDVAVPHDQAEARIAGGAGRGRPPGV